MKLCVCKINYRQTRSHFPQEPNPTAERFKQTLDACGAGIGQAVGRLSTLQIGLPWVEACASSMMSCLCAVLL